MGKVPFFRFFVAMWAHWEARFGTTFAVMLSLAQYVYLATGDPAKTPDWVKAFPPSLWLAIGSVLLFWSCYAAWRDQDNQRESLEIRLATPAIELETPMISWGSSDTFFAIFVAISISNPHGPATGLSQWQVRIRLKDETEVAGEIPLPSSDDIKIPINKDNTMILRRDKEIRERTSDPLPAGGSTEGWLKVVFMQLPANFKPDQVRVIVSCRDVASRHIHTIETVLKGGTDFTLPGVGVIKKQISI